MGKRLCNFVKFKNLSTKFNFLFLFQKIFCTIFNIIWHYSILASFFWMMIEAVYLITVIVAAYSSNKIKLWWYLIIGWILPMIPIVPYTFLTYYSTNT